MEETALMWKTHFPCHGIFVFSFSFIFVINECEHCPAKIELNYSCLFVWLFYVCVRYFTTILTPKDSAFFEILYKFEEFLRQGSEWSSQCGFVNNNASGKRGKTVEITRLFWVLQTWLGVASHWCSNERCLIRYHIDIQLQHLHFYWCEFSTNENRHLCNRNFSQVTV